MVPFSTATQQASIKTPASSSDVIRLQTIFTQILFPNKVLPLNISFVPELKTLLQFMSSIAKLAFDLTIRC